jgi:CRP-like cAMP-binding protein
MEDSKQLSEAPESTQEAYNSMGGSDLEQSATEDDTIPQLTNLTNGTLEDPRKSAPKGARSPLKGKVYANEKLNRYVNGGNRPRRLSPDLDRVITTLEKSAAAAEHGGSGGENDANMKRYVIPLVRQVKFF